MTDFRQLPCHDCGDLTWCMPGEVGTDRQRCIDCYDKFLKEKNR